MSVDTYPWASIPPKNRRSISDTDLDWDQDVEEALMTTIGTGLARIIPLSKFHSSPAKGRLWKNGWAVKHRVVGDRTAVAAWLEPKTEDDVR